MSKSVKQQGKPTQTRPAAVAIASASTKRKAPIAARAAAAKKAARRADLELEDDDDHDDHDDERLDAAQQAKKKRMLDGSAQAQTSSGRSSAPAPPARNLLEGSDDDDDGDDGDDGDESSDSAKLASLAKHERKFTDSNKSWLKLKQAADDDDDDDDDEDDNDEDDNSADSDGKLEMMDDGKQGEGESDEDDVPASSKRRLLPSEIKSMRLDLAKLRERGEADAETQQTGQHDQGLDIDLEALDSEAKSDAISMPDLPMVHTRISGLTRILLNFRELRDPAYSRKQYMAQLVRDLAMYYSYSTFLVRELIDVIGVAQISEFLEANEVPRPITIRTNTLKTKRKLLAQALIARGVNLDPLPWSKEALQVFDSSVPIGATPEYVAGHYMIQSAASLLPVMALDVHKNERILDMASAPGGKSSHIAQLLGNTGCVMANDVSAPRIKAITANLHRLGVRNAIVCNYDGRMFPKVMGNFDRVLLDAPCSGTGVISKDPTVKTSRTAEDIASTVQLQKMLLIAAIDSVDADSATGGVLVYSTCSVLVDENEAVVDYALSKRHVRVVDTALPFGEAGFTKFKQHRFHPSLALSRRYYPHTHNLSGFFVCKLQKLSNGNRKTEAQAANDAAGGDEVGGAGADSGPMPMDFEEPDSDDA